MLAEILSILQSHLAPRLAEPDAIEALQETVRYLAPIPHGGFECRLNNDAQVDVQQCICLRRGDAALQAYLAGIINNSITGNSRSSQDRPTNPAWQRLLHFVTEWRTPSSLLHDELFELWLEFDVDSPSPELPLPSLFFGLKQEPVTARHGIAIAERALELLRHGALSNARAHTPSNATPDKGQWATEQWTAVQKNLHCCFHACPADAFISHIGVMLARPTEALRVNIKRLEPAALVPYLNHVGWPGETDEIAGLMEALSRYVDRITVCLDVGREIYPRIGLECILLQQPPAELRWADFVDYLVEQDLCLPQKGAALLDWPGYTNPTTATAAWPGALIGSSLVEPADRFTILERRLSHIKLVYRPQRALEAKGYLWFGHEWLHLQPETAHTEIVRTEEAPAAELQADII